MPPKTETGRTSRCLVTLVAAVALLFGLFSLTPLRYLLPHGNREHTRRVSCLANLKQLSFAALMYAQDYDERFPLKPAPGGDWMAWQWSAQSLPEFGSYKAISPDGGPVATYAKNYGLTGCPADPSRRSADFQLNPRSSYVWNDALCGRLLKDALGQPLVWDREPYHKHGRNVAFLYDGATAVRWLSERDWEETR